MQGPPDTEKNPAPQVTQLVAPAVEVDDPCGHVVHAELTFEDALNEPTGQLLHVAEKRPKNSPAEQL